MQLTIPTFTVTPILPDSDYIAAPASIAVAPGTYRVTITGKACASTVDTWQVLFKPNLNESGGPSVSAVNYQWQLFQGDPQGLGGTGSGGPTTTLNEMSTIAGVAPTQQPWMWDGIITVTVGGNLTLICAATGDDASKTTEFTEVVIEVTPV